MISPRRKPGRYGLSGRGCFPGHFARAQAGGNSSNSLSKDLDRVRRHWQGPCWVAVVVVDAEVWELKLPRSIIGLCGLPRRGWFVWLLPMRARTRSTSSAPPCARCDKRALRWRSLLLGVGLDVCGCEACRVRGVLGDGWRGGLVGAPAFRLCRGLSWSPATTPLRHYALLSLVGTAASK